MIKIVTDSGCYLASELIAKNDIRIVPLKVHFGHERFDEISGISNEEFYRRLAEAHSLPTTSQPPTGEFKAAYETVLQEGHDVLVLTISSKLSGTYASAVAAAEMLPEANITPFDSRSAGLGLGLMVVTAAEMFEAGHSLAEVIRRLEQMRRDMHVVFMVDTLEYIKRGGRIGAASAFVGTLLKIKPLLTLTGGEILPLEQVRSKRKALERLLAEIQSYVPEPHTPVQIGVMHVRAPRDQEMLAQKVQGLFNIQRLLIGEIGPAIGTHVGPGTLAIGICPNPPDP
ncbi:MAG: DegV family protein [Anaerolineae bacterium]